MRELTFPKAAKIHPKSLRYWSTLAVYSIPLQNLDTIAGMSVPRVPKNIFFHHYSELKSRDVIIIIILKL
jgi:hypothetical protein